MVELHLLVTDLAEEVEEDEMLLLPELLARDRLLRLQSDTVRAFPRRAIRRTVQDSGENFAIIINWAFRPVAPRHMSSQTPSPFIVEVENAWKVYQTGSVRVEALRGVNMGVRRGEMIAVMGPSGCRKTTLLNCFSGLDELSKGKVTVEGVDLAKMSDDQKSEFRAKRMGFIFQAYNLLPVLTAQENVELPLLLAGVSESEAHATSLDVLKMVGLGEWRSHKPMELSGGQQQRVTIARALVNKPAIVWADEPTGNLDSENSQEIIKLLRSLNQQYGLTLVLVSHDPQIAQQTDRIIHMRNGQIEREVKPAITAS